MRVGKAQSGPVADLSKTGLFCACEWAVLPRTARVVLGRTCPSCWDTETPKHGILKVSYSACVACALCPLGAGLLSYKGVHNIWRVVSSWQHVTARGVLTNNGSQAMSFESYRLFVVGGGGVVLVVCCHTSKFILNKN